MTRAAPGTRPDGRAAGTPELERPGLLERYLLFAIRIHYASGVDVEVFEPEPAVA